MPRWHLAQRRARWFTFVGNLGSYLQRKRVATTAKAGKESDDEEHARLLPNDTRNPDRGQRGLQRKKTCILILDQGRERAHKSIGEVAKSPEEPELESEESKLLAR